MLSERNIDAIDYDTVWVVIPAYNERKTIRDVVENARKPFHNVVVVDDGSTDDTASYAEEGGAHIVRHPINMGQGAALRTGLDYAVLQDNCSYTVTFDADGQHHIADVIKMIETMETGPFDIILGSRFLGQTENMPAVRKFVLRLAVKFTNLTSKTKLTDAHNGLRLLTANTSRKMLFRQNRMAHASEIITNISKLNLSYTEVPVKITYTEHSLEKGQKLTNSFRILAELILRWLIK